MPKCGRCLDTGRECTRAYRFKHFRRGAFSRNQRWSYVPRRLKFVLLSGTGDEIAAAEEEDEGETAASELRRHSRSEESSRSRRPSWQSVNPHGPHLHSASPPDQAVPSRQTTASGRVGGHLGSSSSHPNTRQLSVTEKTTETASPSADIADDPVRANIYLERPIWPIQHRDEAILFRHYVEKLAAWVNMNLPPLSCLYCTSILLPTSNTRLIHHCSSIYVTLMLTSKPPYPLARGHAPSCSMPSSPSQPAIFPTRPGTIPWPRTATTSNVSTT